LPILGRTAGDAPAYNFLVRDGVATALRVVIVDLIFKRLALI
jgi:hypothetical protein